MSGVDSSGRAFAVMSFGPAAAPIAAGWLAEITRPTWYWHAESATDEALAALSAEVESAKVGWRLMLAGPELDVLAARAVAEQGGAVASEIAVQVVDRLRRRVWCAHCGTVTDGEGATIECGGCARRLRVERHLSRRHAAYLGVQAG